MSPLPELAPPGWPALLETLSEAAAGMESRGDWPNRQLDALAKGGVLDWVIPRDCGGSERTPLEVIAGYEAIAAACLTTAFVLTQRNGACQRIGWAGDPDVKTRLLRPLGRGETFATVGISHLTTSRQHLAQPPVVARKTSRGYRLSGSVPWVTGAAQADHIVTGGVCEDGRQILVALPARSRGVEILEPARLLALEASQTGPVRLTEVEVDESLVLAGPVERVMSRSPDGGTGSGATSALALGLARRVLDLLAGEAERRADLVEIVSPLGVEHDGVRTDLYATIANADDAARRGHTAASIRQRANSLALRATQAYLAATKGAGFICGHPAERAVREAMFFLVWSCPQPVVQAALREFACLSE